LVIEIKLNKINLDSIITFDDLTVNGCHETTHRHQIQVFRGICQFTNTFLFNSAIQLLSCKCVH